LDSGPKQEKSSDREKKIKIVTYGKTAERGGQGAIHVSYGKGSDSEKGCRRLGEKKEGGGHNEKKSRIGRGGDEERLPELAGRGQ